MNKYHIQERIRPNSIPQAQLICGSLQASAKTAHRHPLRIGQTDELPPARWVLSGRIRFFLCHPEHRTAADHADRAHAMDSVDIRREPRHRLGTSLGCDLLAFVFASCPLSRCSSASLMVARTDLPGTASAISETCAPVGSPIFRDRKARSPTTASGQ